MSDESAEHVKKFLFKGKKENSAESELEELEIIIPEVSVNIYIYILVCNVCLH